ncbi:hypothetical protein LZ32DRAFT_47540 [Colletotrichum eremochloae]|nr:hypothetical protein LZ32DRAFT_47540 [Colletotrichum eremochloae]
MHVGGVYLSLSLLQQGPRIQGRVHQGGWVLASTPNKLDSTPPTQPNRFIGSGSPRVFVPAFPALADSDRLVSTTQLPGSRASTHSLTRRALSLARRLTRSLTSHPRKR